VRVRALDARTWNGREFAGRGKLERSANRNGACDPRSDGECGGLLAGRPFPDDRYGPVALSGEPTPVARRGSFPFWLRRWTGMPIIV
jgi:hypothetical protein